MSKKSKQTLPAKPKELRVSCRASQEIVEGVNAAAKQMGVSDSDIVRIAIKRYLGSVANQPEQKAA